MRHKNGIARLAVAAGLGMSMLAGPFANVALAATGSITITEEHNTGATYDTYQVFAADVDAQDKATNITWNSANKTPVLNFIKAFDGDGTAGSDYDAWLATNHHMSGIVSGEPAVTDADRELAQNAAEFISSMIQGSTTDTNMPTADPNGTNGTWRSTVGTSFANQLARALKTNGTAAATDVTSGTAATLDQGYYLFVTDNATIGTDESGTAPIWAAVSSQPKTVKSKSAIPTVTKKVKEDSAPTTQDSYAQISAEEKSAFDGEDDTARAAHGYYVNVNDEYRLWTAADGNQVTLYKKNTVETGGYQDTADACRNETVSYRLTGTVSDNVNTYDKYFYKFTDTMTHLTMTADDLAGVTVKVDGTDVTSAVKAQNENAIAFSNGVLTVQIDDLLALNRTITKDSIVTVDYNARLDANAVIGSDGNPNVVKVTYSSNPAMTHNGTPGSNGDEDDTSEDTNKVFTYGITLDKVDDDTRQKLQGVTFTIKNSNNRYINQDGSEAAAGTTEAQAYKFTTGADGTFTVNGVDADTYTLHEVTPPSNYKTLAADVVITVTRTLNNDDAQTPATPLTYSDLAATISGGNGDWTTGKTLAQMTEADNGIFSVDNQHNGIIAARVANNKEVTLPGTGLKASNIAIIVGVAMVAGGIVVSVMRKKAQAE